VKQRTPLARWMWENNYQDTTFAVAVENRMRSTGHPDANVSSRTVAKWRTGLSVPRKVALQAILDITGLTAEEVVLT